MVTSIVQFQLRIKTRRYTANLVIFFGERRGGGGGGGGCSGRTAVPLKAVLPSWKQYMKFICSDLINTLSRNVDLPYRYS